MAAPIGIIWGDPIVGSKDTRQGKIGIYAVVTNTDTVTSINVQVRFATMYSCEDGTNNLYFDIGAGVSSASTYVGSASISHPDRNNQWSPSNQTKIFDKISTFVH